MEASNTYELYQDQSKWLMVTVPPQMLLTCNWWYKFEMAAHIQNAFTIEMTPIIIYQDLMYITNFDFIKTNDKNVHKNVHFTSSHIYQATGTFWCDVIQFQNLFDLFASSFYFSPSLPCQFDFWQKKHAWSTLADEIIKNPLMASITFTKLSMKKVTCL